MSYQTTKRQDYFLTAAEAAAKDNCLARVLRRHGCGDPDAMLLANVLESVRCQSSGASISRVAWGQIRFVDICKELFKEASTDWSIVSVMHHRSGARPGELRPTLFESLDRRIRRALRASGIKRAVGGFDLSANEHEKGAFPPHYRPQAWLFVQTGEIRGGERVFRAHFPPSPMVKRPVLIKPWDGNPAAIAYALKPEFYRRVSLAAGNTRKCELRGSQKVEVALAMHAAELHSRVFQYGVDLRQIERELKSRSR